MTLPRYSLLGAWRLPLRIARRDALRHRGRSILVLVMIALPVLAVTAADVLMQTSSVSGVESIDRRMGAAEALVRVDQGIGRVEQGPDPDDSFPILDAAGDGAGPPVMLTADQVAAALGGPRLLEIRSGETTVRTDKGAVTAGLTEVDLADPLTRGLYDLRSGRWPQDSGEVVVNEVLVSKGYAIGETLDRPGADQVDPIIVGVAESTSVRDFPLAAGPIGAFGVESEHSHEWLVDGAAVSWTMVRELNALGITVASRAVITDPPPVSEWPESMQSSAGIDDATVAVIVLVVVMALIEVVLLAGPAFAVGARKQQRSLALMSAAGGTPTQSRRVVIGSAVVLGGVAAALGVVLGLGAARLLVPVIQSRSSSYLGPYDVPWLHLAGIAGFGLLSAFLAAIVPAYLASRQDVVAVLAGRRGDRAPSLKSPILGVVLLGAGIAGSVFGATGGGEIMIAASAIPAVLGMILLIPLVLAGLGKVGGRLPLVLRYAVRDAARHRTRTVPAVAAVAATVAGVVALGVGLTSDEAENRETYTASLEDGRGVVTAYQQDPAWPAIRATVEREAPGAEISEQQGLAESYAAEAEEYTYTQVTVPGRDYLLDSYGSAMGSGILVSDDRLPVGVVGLAGADVARAEQVLRAGGLVAFTSPGIEVDSDTARLVSEVSDNDTGEVLDRNVADIPAEFITLDYSGAGPAAILSTPAAQTVGLEPALVALVLGKDQVSQDQEEAISEALGAVDQSASIYVERGYQAEDETLIAQLILIALGGVLMLGGTLTATFLALSDARPDLATLSAVGASPRTRRGVAAAYAVVVGFVGAVLGAAVGFIPGIAITYPLTGQSGTSCIVEGSGGCVATGEAIGPFLDVPWLMILGLVVALPLLTAVVVGLFARSRLPLVARLD
jgi:putative ABC transport system permease protein